MDIRNTRTTILDKGIPEEKREEIRDYFHKTFTLDETLYDTLASDDAFYLRAEPLRHPLIFYLGHTATFYINKLIIAKLIDKRINPRFESMFAVGVDEMSWDDLDDAHYDWPTVAEVKAYREKVREVRGRGHPHAAAEDADHLGQPVLGHHDGHRAPADPPRDIVGDYPPACRSTRSARSLRGRSAPNGEAPANELLAVSGGPVVLGKPKDHPLYGWDNEFGHHRAEVWDFSAAQYLVSNREYLGFVEDGGYEQQDWWTEEGWHWVRFRTGPAPAVLDRRDGGVSVPDHGPGDRHALGLARGGQLSGGQGVLQLEGAKNRQARPAADRGGVVPAARPARHPGPALLGNRRRATSTWSTGPRPVR